MLRPVPAILDFKPFPGRVGGLPPSILGHVSSTRTFCYDDGRVVRPPE